MDTEEVADQSCGTSGPDGEHHMGTARRAELQIPLEHLADGDLVVVRAGSAIPVDGRVMEGEASVNQASMTGEALACCARRGASSLPEPSWRKAGCR